MTTLTSAQAIDLLLSDPAKYATLDALRSLAAQVATESPGRITVLYSGTLGAGVSSTAVIEGMISQGEDIRVIDRTQAAEFLNSDPFRDAVARAFDATADSLDIRGTPANDFLQDPTRSVWADASARFASGASGDVRIIAPLADYSRTLTQVELSQILQTPQVTSINGVPKEVFQAILDKTGSIQGFRTFLSYMNPQQLSAELI
jgi:hypothetical protein